MNAKLVNQNAEKTQMSDKQLTVLAWIKAKPGMEEAVKRELLAIVGAVRAYGSQFGAVSYDQHQSIENPTVFFLHENWESREGFDNYHASASPDKPFLEKTKDMLAEPVQITFYQMISKDVIRHV